MNRNVTIDDTVLIVSDEGNYFENAENGTVYPIYINTKRRNRETIHINGKIYYTNRIIAKAFPEICGEWFEGCQVHHKDRDTSNNRADNLVVMDKKRHREEHREESSKRLIERNSKPVHQYTLDGEYITSYSSSIEASLALFPDDTTTWHRSSIRNCLCGISNSAFGYRWIHSTEPPLFIERTPTAKEIMREKVGKKITNGELIFNSVTEAAEYYGVGITAVDNCLKGRSKTCCGFKWQYLD